MPSDIFISYAREDRDRVQPIAEALASRGYTVWWDKGLRGGQDFRDAIEEALETARCVVVAWSRDSVESDWVIDEAEHGKRRGLLLPVFIDADIRPPLGFGGVHTNDLSAWLRDPSQSAPFDQFVGDVAALLNQAPAPGPHPTPSPVPPPIGPGHHPAPPPGPRRWLPLAAAGVALLALALFAYLSFTASPSEVEVVGGDTVPGVEVAPGATAGTGGADTAAAETASAQPVAGTPGGALAGLRCTLPGEARNPIRDRAERLTGVPFSVDTGQHLLLGRDGAPVSVVVASRVGRALRSRRLIVAHSTVAPSGSVERYFEAAQANGSVHVLIARDGTVKQLVPFDLAAQHAGGSQWRDVQGINYHSIGVDMDNLGPLTRGPAGWQWQSRAVPADSVQVIGGRGWHRYTDAQLRTFFHVSCALRRAYPALEEVVGHDSIAGPGRRADPGPAFPVRAMRASLFPERR